MMNNNNDNNNNILKRLQHANKLWKRRLDVVLFMEEWIAVHLKPRGAYDRVDRTRDALLAKGREYLYGHLFWGRMRFGAKKSGGEGGDPLFYDYDDGEEDEDVTLREQLVDGAYGAFVETLARCRRLHLVEGGSDDSRFDEPVLLEDVEEKYVQIMMNPNYNRLRCRLHSLIHDRAIRTCVLVGLILRYRCIGGFESNLHGSVPTLLPGFTECFASPLNHRSEIYHSFFDDDVGGVFNARPDFFRTAVDNNVLPPGDYHINPPFHEGVLDAVAAIVKSSFESGAAIRAVVVVPRWRDAAFIATLDSVRCVCCRVLERRRFEYEHFNGGCPRTDTLFYCMVDAGRYGDEEFFAACEGLAAEDV